MYRYVGVAEQAIEAGVVAFRINNSNSTSTTNNGTHTYSSSGDNSASNKMDGGGASAEASLRDAHRSEYRSHINSSGGSSYYANKNNANKCVAKVIV